MDLGKVPGSGPKGRITQLDVQNYVKGVIAGSIAAPAGAASSNAGGGNFNVLPWPSLDFSKFGPTELLPLSRIKKISGPNLHRNWVQIPHVTQFDEADVTDLEAFRVDTNNANAKNKDAAKLTMLSSYHLSESTIGAYIDALEKFDPVVLHAYPSSVAALAAWLNARHRRYRGTALLGVMTSSETGAGYVA